MPIQAVMPAEGLAATGEGFEAKGRLFPIHTEYADEFSQNFERVLTLKDGEAFVLN